MIDSVLRFVPNIETVTMHSNPTKGEPSFGFSPSRGSVVIMPTRLHTYWNTMRDRAVHFPPSLRDAGSRGRHQDSVGSVLKGGWGQRSHSSSCDIFDHKMNLIFLLVLLFSSPALALATHVVFSCSGTACWSYDKLIAWCR